MDDVRIARFEVLEGGSKLNLDNLLTTLQSNLAEERRTCETGKMMQIVSEFLDNH